jgi:hypothetical protein
MSAEHVDTEAHFDQSAAHHWRYCGRGSVPCG